MLEAKATSQMQRQWSLGDSRFQPKIQTARKVDSRKKARVGSIGKREPKMAA